MAAELIAGTIGLSVALLILSLFRSNRASRAHERVARLAPSVEDGDPLASSFAQRIVQPVASRVTGAAMVVLPGRVLASLRRQLEMAGAPISQRTFLLIWLTLGLVIPLSVLLFVIVTRQEIGRSVVFGFAFAVLVGSYLPWLVLKRRASARARAIQRRLPDAIDLIITNVEAGLGLQAALLTVSERMGGPVAEEFGRAVREISLGRERTEVFEQMALRSGASDMRVFARAVAQSDRTGFPVARILRNQSVEMRDRRRQNAREKAAKVPVKIILPTALFIFPTLFMVILGPIALYAVSLME